MDLKNIKFNIELCGLVYTCKAFPKTESPVDCYVLNIETMNRIYRLDMRIDTCTKEYTMRNFTGDTPPEITALEFKISDILSRHQ